MCPLDRHQPRHHDAADTRKRAGRRHPRHHGVDDAQPEQPPTPPRCMTAHATGRTTLISVRPALPNTPPYEHRSRRSVDAAGEDRRSLCCSSGGRRGNHPTAAPTAVSGGGARAAGRGRSSAARQHQPPRHLAPPACTPAGGAESGAGAAGFEPGDTDPVQCGRDPVCDGRCRPTMAAPERKTHRPRGP